MDQVSVTSNFKMIIANTCTLIEEKIYPILMQEGYRKYHMCMMFMFSYLDYS